jgi:glycosyltransferase involved in cell wall biosynthesis
MLTGTHTPFDARIFHKESKSLRKFGYEVTLVAPSEEIIEECDRDGIHLVPLPAYTSKGVRAVNGFRLIWKGLRIRAHVLHTHELDALFAGLVIKLLTGRKLIYDAHEHHASMIAENPKIPGLFEPWVESIVGAMEEIACRFVDEVITVNRTLRERYLRMGKNAVVLYNCPVLSLFDHCFEKRHTGVSNGRPVVIYQGGISRTKGLDKFLLALKKVKEQFPDVMFSVVGKLLGGEAPKNWMEHYVKTFDLTENFEITGWVPHEEVSKYLNSANIGVILFQPTHYNNLIGLPNKLFEYMACGKPVVASNFPEIRNVVTTSKCGLLIDPTDSEEIARAIVYLLEHPEEAVQMGRNGRKAVEEQYNWEKMEGRLRGVYEAVSRCPTLVARPLCRALR